MYVCCGKTTTKRPSRQILQKIVQQRSATLLCAHTHKKHLFFYLLHTYSSGLDPRVPEILSPVWKNLWNEIVEELRVRNVRSSRSRLLRVQLLSGGNRRGERACQGRPLCARKALKRDRFCARPLKGRGRPLIGWGSFCSGSYYII
jgi:hypothetical protein